MHGNVEEWCLDYYDSTFYSNGATDPLCTTDSGRVTRGGSWDCYAQYCRSAIRFGCSPMSNVNHIGFRLALVQTD